MVEQLEQHTDGSASTHHMLEAHPRERHLLPASGTCVSGYYKKAWPH